MPAISLKLKIVLGMPTVVESNGSIKVKWDAGQTSYFRHSEPGNIQLEE